MSVRKKNEKIIFIEQKFRNQLNLSFQIRFELRQKKKIYPWKCYSDEENFEDYPNAVW